MFNEYYVLIYYGYGIRKPSKVDVPLNKDTKPIQTETKYILLLPNSRSQKWPEGSLLRHRGVEEGATPFPGLLHFTFDTYLIMLSVKQAGIKYCF